MQPTPLQTKKPWYKTIGGITFLSFLGVITLGGTVFFGLVGYYSWQINHGNINTLVEEFKSEFSTDTSLKNTKNLDVIVKNSNQYIRSSNPTNGSKDAPVRIIMFVDFECPFCARAHPIIKELEDRYGDALQIIFKHFPIESIHPDAVPAAHAASCASEQDAFWEYHDTLFYTQKLDEVSLLDHAKTLGLDAQQFAECLNTQKYTQAIEQDLFDGIDVGVRGTPTYIVNDIKIEGVIYKETWDEIILEQLQNI